MDQTTTIIAALKAANIPFSIENRYLRVWGYTPPGECVQFAQTANNEQPQSPAARDQQQYSALFRHTPWLFDRLLDAPALLRFVARREGIDPSTLGQKDKSGILKSMASRQAFLSDRSHRIRFVYLPRKNG